VWDDNMKTVNSESCNESRRKCDYALQNVLNGIEKVKNFK
jgi:hypothetical protein